MKYTQIVQLLEQFANKHKDVQRFKADTLDRLPDFEMESEAFPIIYAVPTIPYSGVNSTSGYKYKRYTFDIHCLVPRIDTDDTDLDNVILLNQTTANINQTSQILFDLYEAVDALFEIEMPFDVTLTPVNNYANSKLQGVRGTFTFEVDSEDTECNIPLECPLKINPFIPCATDGGEI